LGLPREVDFCKPRREGADKVTLDYLEIAKSKTNNNGEGGKGWDLKKVGGGPRKVVKPRRGRWGSYTLQNCEATFCTPIRGPY